MWTLIRMICDAIANEEWETIRVERGTWDITSDFGNYKKYAVYEIQHCKAKNQYRLVCSGYKPKQNHVYSEAIEILNNYKNEKKSAPHS